MLPDAVSKKMGTGADAVKDAAFDTKQGTLDVLKK
jgi:hypothetical protein